MELSIKYLNFKLYIIIIIKFELVIELDNLFKLYFFFLTNSSLSTNYQINLFIVYMYFFIFFLGFYLKSVLIIS
jgi:hypothetical protein